MLLVANIPTPWYVLVAVFGGSNTRPRGGAVLSSSRQAEARIRQICCLGLGGVAIMPALLRELHALVPSCSNTFFWTDEKLQLSGICDENPDADQFGSLYFQEFYNRRETEVHPGFTHSMRFDRGVTSRDSAITVDKSTFYKSDLYNLIFRQLGYDDFLRLIIREGGRPLGALQLWRGPGDPPFTADQIRCLSRLEPFLAHALAQAPDLRGPLVPSGETALIIADRDATLLHLSRHARRLLRRALTGGMTLPGVTPAALPGPVAQLCRALTGIFSEADCDRAPVWRYRNSCGGFIFRAYCLESGNAPSSLIGVTITHEEPLPLRLMRGMERLPLSARQSEVCLQMASGRSYREIAAQLKISRETAIAHGRSVYDKLGIHNRDQLTAVLLASQSTTADKAGSDSEYTA